MHTAAPAVPRRAVTRLGVAAAALAAVLVLAGCGSSTASPTPGTPTSAPPASPQASPPPGSTEPTPGSTPGPTPLSPEEVAALYRSIEDDVVAIRGLRPEQPVDPKLLDEAGLRERLRASFDKENPADRLAAEEGILKALGLLPADASYEDLVLELLDSQVAGLYDPDTKELYVVSKKGDVGPVEQVSFAHEFTHALQDQEFGLDGLGEVPDQGDGNLAALSLVEGDASLAMTLWAQQELTPAEMIEMLGAANDPEAARLLAEMPPILRETLLFPYSAGLQFVLGIQARDGWEAVDRAFDDPPVSTEQILHPDRYPAERPISVDLPDDLPSAMGAGWRLGLEDTLGELQLRVWLQSVTAASGVDPAAAADGWGGDRLAYLQGPNGAWALALRTAWDSPADAAEFERAAEPVVESLGQPGAVLPGEGGTTRWVVLADDAPNLDRLANALGLAG